LRRETSHCLVQLSSWRREQSGWDSARVRLTDGTFVQADDQFLRNSILHEGMQAVAGYPPIVPAFNGFIPETEVLELIAYLKSFKGTSGDPAASP
jgi:hypothetical protein